MKSRKADGIRKEKKEGKTMRRPVLGHEKPEKQERRWRLPLYCWILMAIGFMTVLYFLITYLLMPLLAMLTVS